ncbi:MAG: calcium/proton exchanger [Gemmatimonadota bacterium]|nr:calcium/proton exchanger [Gemmatimonadota bacterium]
MVLGYVMHAPAVWIFLTACLGVLPLAGLMGEATEHLAHRTGPTVGGLLNATFGNAAELIIAIVALRAGLVDLVKASITGSILGNLLLILGLALIAAGTKRSELKFNRTNAGMSSGMLALAVVALVFPALYHSLHPEAQARASELYMSEAVAVILIITYAFSLLFTLRTHRRLFGGEAHPMVGPVWSPTKALVILGLATVGVAVESELLVHAATEATEAVGLSTVFLGLIIIPIIGNAAEHAAAVVLSRKGQIDLGLQIALGSSTQIALLVAPLLVFAGVIFGQPMDLVFAPFEVAALGLATIVTAIITLDGESHWFEGVQLLAVYAMIAVGAYFLN